MFNQRPGSGVLNCLTHSYAGINRIRFKGFVIETLTSQAHQARHPSDARHFSTVISAIEMPLE